MDIGRMGMKRMNTLIFDRGFDNLKDRQFALYGASKGGEKVFSYFEKVGFADKVVCFVDGDKNKHGKSLLGREILSIDFLRQNPQISVVISSIFILEIFNSLKLQQCVNDVFTSFNCFGVDFFFNDNYSDNFHSELDVDMQYVNSLYDLNDVYTKKIIATYFYSHLRSGYCAIQPILKTVDIVPLPVTEYWYDEKTTLLRKGGLTMCDAGAYDGDSLRQWVASYMDNINKYYLFEPDPNSLIKLHNTVGELGMENKVVVYPAGLGDKNCSLRFLEADRGSRFSEDGKIVIDTLRLDDIDLEVGGKLCIKMDIEGYELEALAGAQETIKKYKPELAICVYHKVNDIHKIPEYIKMLVPDYKCIIRGGSHAVCYASAR